MLDRKSMFTILSTSSINTFMGIMKSAVQSSLYLTVILAVLLQAMIPMGFMPSMQDGSLMRVEICTASGLAEILVKDNQPHDGKTDNHAAKKMCPYAHAPLSSLIQALGIKLSDRVKGSAQLFLKTFIFNRFLIKNYFSQGPPASSCA